MHQKDLRYSLTITNEPLLRSHRTVMIAADTKGGPACAERTEACLPFAYANTCPTANAVSTYILYGPACHFTMFGLPALAKLPTFTHGASTSGTSSTTHGRHGVYQAPKSININKQTFPNPVHFSRAHIRLHTVRSSLSNGRMREATFRRFLRSYGRHSLL